MFKLFIPESKVHRDRRLMRETDSRMAKYSRRGILINFCVYLFCVWMGDLYLQAPTVTSIMTIGLLLLTGMRSFYLFRFDSLYPRAPSRWRNQYFLASLLGAIWWSVILVAFTRIKGLDDVTTILWFYTIVFFSSTANALAPYNRYMSWYQFFGLIPGALAMVSLSTINGYLYGIIILLFFLLMIHQGRIVAESYWKSLETNQALTRKTIELEAEKRDMEAADQFSTEFLQNLGSEVRVNLNDLLGSLSLLDRDQLNSHQSELVDMAHRTAMHQLELINNVGDYLNTVGRQYERDVSVFNLRRLLENVLEDLFEDAAHQHTELNYLLNSTIPLRVRGDAVRVQQILHQLIYHVMYSTQSEEITIVGNYKLDNQRDGNLTLKIRLIGSGEDKYSAWETTGESEESASTLVNSWENSTSFVVCKALAESLSGFVEVSPSRHQVLVSLPLEISGSLTQEVPVNARLKGKRALLVDVSKEVRKPMMREFKDWGLSVKHEKDLDAVVQLMWDARNDDEAFDLVLFYTRHGNRDWMDISQQILDNEQLRDVAQLVVGNRRDMECEEVTQYAIDKMQVARLNKPLSPHAAHNALEYLLLKGDYAKPACLNHDKDHVLSFEGHTVLLVDDHRANQLVTQRLLEKLKLEVTVAINGKEALDKMQQQTFDIVLMDCNMPIMDGFEATQIIRDREIEEELKSAERGDQISEHIPIIGMSSHLFNGEKSRSFAAGMDEYLAKPIEFYKLQRLLQRWLNG
ncbi:response regulator [Pseudoteredinibacter isoporae]|uniref:response regulator n=1 Tax=Pseudoteredinibacter isoporae TaxID=570281 RepID=UPI003109860B